MLPKDLTQLVIRTYRCGYIISYGVYVENIQTGYKHLLSLHINASDNEIAYREAKAVAGEEAPVLDIESKYNYATDKLPIRGAP